MLAGWNPTRLSYRVRLLALVAAAGCPLLILLVLGLWQYRSTFEGEVVRDRVSLAKAAALDVQMFLADSRAEAQMLALDPLVRQPASASDLERLLERVRQALPTWQSVGVFGADGWNLALTDSPPRSIDHSSRPYFQRVLATGSAAVGPAAMPSENGSPAPVAVIGVPVQF